jgi:hypothetical protein
MDPAFVLSLVLGAASVGGGIFAWSTRKLGDLDHRIDTVEITVHRDFVRKDDLMPMIDRLDQQMQHIDAKLDRVLLNGRNFPS